MEPQFFAIPAQMGSISSATVLQTGSGDVLICHDNSFLYATKLNIAGGNVVFQKFNLPEVVSLSAIIKNYFLVVFSTQKLVVFEVGFNEEGKVMLKFIYQNKKQFMSYFLREVVQNMAELQICYPQNEVHIYQFTVNGKVGNMSYSFTNQNKLRTCERQQLYGSKTILSVFKKQLYYFTNFSNKFVNAQPLYKMEMDLFNQFNAYPLAYICISKVQEFYLVLSNFVVVHCMNPKLRHRVICDAQHTEQIQKLGSQQIQKATVPLKVTTYFDLLMVQDSNKQVSYVFQIKQNGSVLVGVEYGKYNWFWATSKKLVGLSTDRNHFKIIHTIQLNQTRIISENNNAKQDYVAEKQIKESKQAEVKKCIKQESNSPTKEKEEGPQKKQKEEETHKQQENNEVVDESLNPPLPFIPKKIIQKNKVSVSKTLNKSKEVEPISKQKETEGKQKPKDIKEEKIIDQQQIKIEGKQDKKGELKQTQLLNNKQTQTTSKEVKLNQHKTIPPFANKTKPSEQPKQSNQLMNEDIVTDTIETTANSSNQQEITPQTNNQAQNGQVYIQNQPTTQDNSQQQKSSSTDKQVVKQQQKSQQSEFSKSHTVLISKLCLEGVGKHSLNMFNSSINRNNIFNKIKSQSSKEQNKKEQQEYYNPFTSALMSPLKKVESKTQETKDNRIKQQNIHHHQQNIPHHQQNIQNYQQNIPHLQQSIQNHQQNTEQTNRLTIDLSTTTKATSTMLNIIQKEQTNNIQRAEQHQESKEVDWSASVQVTDIVIETTPKMKQQQIADRQAQLHLLLRQQQQKQEEHNRILLQRIKHLFDQTTHKLIKEINDMNNAMIVQPYITEKLKTEMQKKILDVIKQSLAGDFANKLQKFFTQIFRQSNDVQEESVKFYKEATIHRSKNLQVQLLNQEKVVKQIRDIESMLRFCISSLKQESRETFQNMIRDWNLTIKDTTQVIANLTAMSAKLAEEEQMRAKRYEETKGTLAAIKDLLTERINQEQARKQRQIQRDETRLKQQKKKKSIKLKQKSKVQTERPKKMKKSNQV